MSPLLERRPVVAQSQAMEGLKKPDFSGCHSRLVWTGGASAATPSQSSPVQSSHSPAQARTSTAQHSTTPHARIHSRLPSCSASGSLSLLTLLPLLPYPHLNEPSSSKSRLSLLLSSASTEFLLRLHTPTTQTTFYHKYPSQNSLCALFSIPDDLSLRSLLCVLSFESFFLPDRSSCNPSTNIFVQPRTTAIPRNKPFRYPLYTSQNGS